MQANRHLKRNHSRIASSDSEHDEEMNNPETDPPSKEQDHPRTSLVNNEDNNDAVDTAEDKVNFYLKRILLMF